MTKSEHPHEQNRPKPILNVGNFVPSRLILEGKLHRAPRAAPRSPARQNGGAERDRTDDLLLAKQALSQLSYSPVAIWNRYPVGPARMNCKSGGPGKT
jgi:hypothetical protein